jgi:hypothetical protein
MTRLEVALVVARCDGVLRRAAHEIGCPRRQTLYDFLEDNRLWPVVNRARRARIMRARIESAQRRAWRHPWDTGA